MEKSEAKKIGALLTEWYPAKYPERGDILGKGVEKAIKINEDNAAAIDNNKCIQCGACVYQCPFGAISDKSYILNVIDILKNSNYNKKGKFQYPVTGWGIDLQSEHERYLVEKHFKKPVILTDYPIEIKAFYMKQNEDGKTVRAMDVLFPGIGEIVGGSERETDLNKLLKRMEEVGIPQESMEWYLDTRRFGSVPHSGYGLGFERLMLFITGMGNIRDVIAFPRTPKNCEY